jgi:hypothetical protein
VVARLHVLCLLLMFAAREFHLGAVPMVEAVAPRGQWRLVPLIRPLQIYKQVA